MRVADVAEVASIERRSYAFPWPRAFFRYCLRGGFECWLLERGRAVQGYGIMAYEEGKAHILNLCIRPESQRRGFGAQLLAFLLARATERGVPVAQLEVNQSNRAARHLYRRVGFTNGGIRKGYYPGKRGPEDAIVMVRRLQPR